MDTISLAAAARKRLSTENSGAAQTASAQRPTPSATPAPAPTDNTATISLATAAKKRLAAMPDTRLPTFKDNATAIAHDVYTAVSGIGDSFWGFADWVIRDDEIAQAYGVENKVGQFFDNQHQKHLDTVEENRRLGEKADPTVAAIGDYVVQPLVAAIPYAALAYATGGGSVAASGGAGLASGAATASTAARVGTAVTSLLKNPSFWYSFIQTSGGSYNEAKDEGATETEASAYALLNGFAGSMIEMGGGIQQLPGTKQGVRQWIKSTLEEGGEEVLQGVTAQLVSKALYEQDKEWFSLTDTEAVVNPSRMAQEFGGGLVVGGIMGGGQIAVGKAVNSVRLYSAANQLGNQFLQGENGHTIDEALQIGLSNAKGTDAYAAALKLQERVNNRQEVSPYAVGRMVMESQSAAALQAKAIEQMALQSAAQGHFPTDAAENIAAAAVKLNQPVVFGNAAQFQAGQAAYYDHNSRMVVLNPNANEQALQGAVLAHEMVHSAQATQQWATLENTVRQMMGDAEWQAYLQETASRYAARGHQLTDLQVREEAVARWVGENLFKQGFAQAVAKGDAKTGGILLRGLDKLRRAVGIKNSPSARDIAMLERLVMQAMENRTGTRSGEGVQYEINSDFAREYDQWDKKDPRTTFAIGTTSPVLQSLGLPVKAITWDAAKIIQIKNKHPEMTDSIIKRVPEVLESPIVVMQSKQSPSRWTMFGELYAGQNPVLVVLELNPLGRNGIELDEMKLVSSYAKNKAQNFINNSATLYVADDKKRVSNWEKRTGLQLPVGLSVTNSNTTVTQNAGGVNTHSMQNGGGNTQSAYISEDQFVDRMGGTPSVTANGGVTPSADGYTSSTAYGGPPSPQGEGLGAVQVDEGAVLERAVGSQLQRRQVDVSHLRVTDRRGESHYDADAAMDTIAAQIGEEELLRRMYNATQIDRPKGSVTINGQTVDANAYVDAYEQSLPDDPAALREHIRSLEEQRTAAILQMERDGTLEDYTRGGLKIDLQLFAANRKWELLQLDPEEGGKKTRQFFEKRLRGTDANHHDELVELLSGRSENYNPISTQKQLDRANNRLRSDAKYQQKLIKRIGRYDPSDLFTPVDVAAAQLLINDALNEGNYEVAANLIAGLSRKGTELGRAVQAFSIMARLTPEGTLRMAQRTMKAEADYIIGEGASEGLDMLADDIADAIRAAERKGISADEIADRIRNGRPRGDVDMIPYGAMQTQEGTADGGDTETGETGMKPFEGMEPYAEPTYVDGVVQNTAPMTRGELVTALAEDLAAEERNYLSREQIEETLWKVVEESTNIPEQVKRYVLKKIRKDDGSLANRIYEVYRKGDLSQVKLRRAMEQALELPSLSTEDIQTVVEMGTRIQQLQDDPIAQADAMDDLYDFLAAKMSVNGWDKLQAWRKFGMLANVKTHIRNTVSNGAYAVIRKTDDAVAMAIERIFNVDPEKRAAMLGWRHTRHGQSILPALQERAKLAVLEMQKRGAKYETGSGQLKQRRKFFGESKVGEALNDANSWNSDWLEREDIWFFRPAYIDALGQMMTARGTTEITNEMHEKAMQRALEATFRADNAMSEVVGSLKRFQNSDKAGLRLFGHAMDVIVPFHKTPANIATQTVMHSPIGIVKGAFDLYNATKGKGSKDAATAINTMAKGITGSALLAIGILLGKAGLFNTGFGKTEKERAADELAGLQENAFVFGDVSVSFDWLQPAASPLIVGASIGKRLAEDGLSLSAVFGAVMDGTDSLFEMTMLQSLYDILGGYDAGATATAASVAENVVSQSIPTLLGQAARAIDPVQRKTTADSEFMTIVNQVVAKIPVLTYLLDPELDVWGNEVYRTGKPGAGTAALNAVQQFALPSNVKVGTGRGDRVSAEILRLYRNQGSKAIPTAVSRDDAKDGELDYVEINRLLGQVNRTAVEDFINNDWPYAVMVDAGNGKTKKVTKYYRNMTDEERVRVLQRIYTNTKKTVTEPEEEKDSTDGYFEEIFRRLQ